LNYTFNPFSLRCAVHEALQPIVSSTQIELSDHAVAASQTSCAGRTPLPSLFFKPALAGGLFQ